MKVSVCIASIRSATLRAAIDSIRRQTFPDWELIVVGQGEDASLKALGEAAASADPRIRYIHLERKGTSFARNAGIEAATGEVVAITDDDCEAQADWVATLRECFLREPAVGLVGGAVLAPRPNRRGLATCPSIRPAEALYDPLASARRAPRGWDWIGANAAVRRDVIARVGPFDECLGPGTEFRAGEDTDYKLRLEAQGVPMRSTPRAVVYHTYGHRYGLQALLNFSRSYATGNGALAGKLSLMGDPRGREWVEITRRECTVESLRPRTFPRLPLNLLRLRYYVQAYNRCRREFRFDAARGVLVPRGAVMQMDGG